jgi:cytochrome c-type biogenesis protein CcmH
LAQFIVASRDGRVTPSAKVEFEKVLRLDPGNKIARFFLGLEREQAGDLGAAFEIWSDLSADSGAEDLWLPELRARLQTLAEELDRQPDELGVARDDSSRSEVEEAKIDTPGPSAEDVAAAGQMTADERGEMIRGMVERLAARLEEEPNDVEGWKRLGNARRVLGELLEAEQAFERALEIDPDDFVALEAQAQIALERAGGDLIPELTQRNYRRILKLDGRRLDALWYLGLAAQQQSRTEEAQDLWQTLLGLLPPDSPDAREVKRRLDEIKG